MSRPFAIIFDGEEQQLVNLFDSVLEQQHRITIALSRFPVQQNIVYIDNATKQPNVVNLTIGCGNVVTPNLVPGTNFRQTELWQTLNKMANRIVPYDVVTHLGKYTSMIMTQFSTQITKRTGHGLLVDIEFTQIRNNIRGEEGFEVLTPTALDYFTNIYRGRASLTRQTLQVAA